MIEVFTPSTYAKKVENVHLKNQKKSKKMRGTVFLQFHAGFIILCIIDLATASKT